MILKNLILSTMALMVLSCVPRADGNLKTYSLFEIRSDKEIPLSRAVDGLKKTKIILVGERHNRKDHHMAQLALIKALHESGASIAIGLEMFRHEEQESLDQWIDGRLGEEDFRKTYDANWNYAWSLYRMIFHYARQNKIPMLGLNVPRDVTRQVARQGFQSLSRSQKTKLPNVSCQVSPEYMAFIKQAYGSHAHETLNFTYFCEAQLVWDKAMALHAIKYLESNPVDHMVLLTGNGHAWKWGIPDQVRQSSRHTAAVILPKIEGFIEPGLVTEEDADYIFLQDLSAEIP